MDVILRYGGFEKLRLNMELFSYSSSDRLTEKNSTNLADINVNRYRTNKYGNQFLQIKRHLYRCNCRKGIQNGNNASNSPR